MITVTLKDHTRKLLYVQYFPLHSDVLIASVLDVFIPSLREEGEGASLGFCVGG